jgi:hypothetical protein
MKKQVLQVITIALTMVSRHASGMDTAALLGDSAAGELLSKKCIRAETAGIVPVRFDDAASVLKQPGLVQAVQKEYARSVARDGKVQFPIIKTAPGTYHYVNKKNQKTQITELVRKQTAKDTFDMVYHAEGKRFFGKYEVIIHLRAIDADAAGVVYTAQIHAYPRNGPMRFFARRLGVVERYFRKKTDVITDISTRICTGLCDELACAHPTDPHVLQPEMKSYPLMARY